ncbi:putative heme d1 biosynthesis radical SAM protein NirJ2 [Clostridium sp. DJ247]|uniref:putative heme d1 biosynthesis radical SAM protein NirJ2 n=1 Tax=Clostridium sp. DJ247 TaxID=2726188 RepID=UPI0016265C39|nr:putative heme d1 biosynthesis radical SAM protein NirJ2 [Clostridium sp. DJ247]MBC2581834.1 putative heme d1 biosynthesis radical SAM protein NirJ2 [Clostridium sp. DJ247]
MIVSWNTTNKCNMYCDHCYRNSGLENEGELTTEQGKSLLEEIAKAGFKIMIFSGGEPLMRKDIFELISYADELGLRPVLGSNGTLLTEENVKKLKQCGLKAAGISLDSVDGNRHNKFRKCDNAWRDTLFGMKNCRNIGLPFQIHTTVMKWNKDEIINMANFAEAMGARAYHPFFLVPTGRGENIENEILDTEEYEHLLYLLMKKQQETSMEIKPTCAPQFIRVAKDIGMETRFTKGCLAGTSYCIIDPKGNVQPCAYLKELAGNVKESPFSKIWSESSIFNKLRTLQYEGNCGICKSKKNCGGCRARASYYNSGNYMAEDTICINTIK